MQEQRPDQPQPGPEPKPGKHHEPDDDAEGFKLLGMGPLVAIRAVQSVVVNAGPKTQGNMSVQTIMPDGRKATIHIDISIPEPDDESEDDDE